MEPMEQMKREEEVFWVNPRCGAGPEGAEGNRTAAVARESAEPLGKKDILDAEARLRRFAPLLAEMFPETRSTGGIIESELTETEKLRAELSQSTGAEIRGRLFVKRDSDLPVAGSVKARGGIYEVLKHTEEIALERGLLSGPEDDYRRLASPEARKLLSGYQVQVGSTGNLGMSIGIMSAALGYRATVHMSADAKQWKKDLLRSRGAEVVEYEGDYGEAVRRGRELSDRDPASYFVDDENSKTLFLGYAVAALRLEKQLKAQKIPVDPAHPLIVYIPCGVGGAPGGICFGLKTVFGENVHVFFGEPVASPCMLLGLVTGKHSGICVQDIGLSGKTEADGLAVGRPSGFVGQFIEPMLSGEFTVKDERLNPYCRLLYETEGIFIEPSSCTALHGPVLFSETPEGERYRREHGLQEHMDTAAQILWATGGRFVPEELRSSFLHP